MMSRTRTVLSAVAASAALALLAACSSGGGGSTPSASGSADDDAPVKLTYVSYGGSGQDAQTAAFQTPYTAAHPNVTFLNSSPADVAPAKAQVLSGNVEWDVMSVAPAAAEQNCGTVFTKLKVPALAADKKDLVPGALGTCYVGNFSNATPLAYNEDMFPDPAKAPKTLADFFDTKKFPGKRGVITNLQNGILEYPLLADGVKPSKLYPLDVDRALQKWDTIKSDTIFAPNVGALQQAIASGQVSMFLESDSRLISLLDSGMHIKVIWDETVVSVNGLAIPKGSKNTAAAERFLEYVAQPEPQAKIAELIGVPPVNKLSKPTLTPSGQAVAIYGPDNDGVTVDQDIEWYAKNFNQVTTQLTNWLAG
jgi:putative spermidine/putrescine transport system substrate-binding protein